MASLMKAADVEAKYRASQNKLLDAAKKCLLFDEIGQLTSKK